MPGDKSYLCGMLARYRKRKIQVNKKRNFDLTITGHDSLIDNKTAITTLAAGVVIIH